MRWFALVVSLIACGSPPKDAAETRPLGMNDVTMLVPLPAATASPVIGTLADLDGEMLVTRGLYAGLVAAPGDLAPKGGQPYAYEDWHLVGLRFDLCARRAPGPCPDGADGELRLVLQPLYTQSGAVLAHDLALHAFYPIPAAELPGVVTELRALARLAGASLDRPFDAPLGVSPALGAAAPPGDYAPRLRALVALYARWDRLVKLTAFGQDAQSAAFAWRFRGVELPDGPLGVPVRIQIPAIAAGQQSVRVSGGDTIYSIEPEADAPAGFSIAANGALFAEATAEQRARSLEALAELQNPLLHDAGTVPCVGCHVATFLTARRAEVAGIDPETVRGRFESPYNTAVDTIAGRDGRSLRALGWATSFPAISQRVANETAQVLEELERRFPSP